MGTGPSHPIYGMLGTVLCYIKIEKSWGSKKKRPAVTLFRVTRARPQQGKVRLMKNFKKNQVVIFVIALMLVTAGYLNFSNQEKLKENLIPTSSVADSEEMAAIGDATLVNANEVTNEEVKGNVTNNIIDNTQNANMQNTIQSNTEAVDTSSNLEDVQENTTQTNSNYFTQSKIDRDNMYSQMLENYQKILETDNLEADEKTIAQEEIKKINDEKNAIMIAENIIKTKGVDDLIILVNGDSVNVVVGGEELEKETIAQIQNIITRELGTDIGNIHIMNK